MTFYEPPQMDAYPSVPDDAPLVPPQQYPVYPVYSFQPPMPPASKHTLRNVVLTIVAVMIVGGVGAAIGSANHSSTASHATGQPATTSLVDQPTVADTPALDWSDWHAATSADVSAVSDDMNALSSDADASDLAGIESDSATLLADVRTLQADPPPPDESAAQLWYSMLSSYEAAGIAGMSGDLSTAAAAIRTGTRYLVQLEALIPGADRRHPPSEGTVS